MIPRSVQSAPGRSFRGARVSLWLLLGLAPGVGTALDAPPKETKVSAEGRIELGTHPVRVSLGALPPSCAEGSRFVLDLEGIDYDERPGVYYELYLNLPEGEPQPNARSIHYVGNLSFYGLKEAGAARGEEITQDFDVTPTVRALRAQRLWSRDAASVTFVMGGRLHPVSGQRLPVASGTKARLRRVTLTCE